MTSPNQNIPGKVRAWTRNHPLLTSIAGIALCTVVIVWLAMVFLDYWTNHGDNVTVPQIKYTQFRDASAKLSAHDLRIEISDSIYDTSVAPGTVVESWPKAGSVVKRGRQVYVTITAFTPKNVTISQPITGVSVRQAVSYLTALGIRSIRQVSVPSEYPDLVEGAHADGRPLGVGSSLPVDATVVLEVGTVPEPVYDGTDSISAEDEVMTDLVEYSTYSEE